MESPFFVAKYNQHKRFLLCKDSLTGTVVDFGCGGKPFKKYLPNQVYIGIDNRYGTPDIVADVTNVPQLENEMADSVICSEVLEHLSQPLKCVQEMTRVLKKGGHIYITVPMYWYLHYLPNDYWRFTSFSLMAIMENFNFKVKQLGRYGGLNYFIACRIVETIYNGLHKIFGKKISLFLLAPVQIIFYLYSKFDYFNKRDAAGWYLLAEKA